MKGRRKAAVLLVSLGPQRAAEVLGHLRGDEIEALSLEMAQLEHVGAGLADPVLAELVAMVEAYDSLVAGGIDYAREVLERALGPERAGEIIGRLTSVIEKRPFEFMSNVPAERIVALLGTEAPQTVAVVVAYLHSRLAAQVLSRLPERDQAEIALRIALMNDIRPDIVKQVEDLMRQRIATVQHEVLATGGVQALAEILGRADQSTERNVLESLEQTDEELGAEVKRLLFVFEDIITLDARAIQLAVRESDPKDLALALRGVSEEVRQTILANMSERGAQMLREEIECQPPQRKRTIEEARGRIIAIVRRLEEAGAIIVSRGEEDIAL